MMLFAFLAFPGEECSGNAPSLPSTQCIECSVHARSVAQAAQSIIGASSFSFTFRDLAKNGIIHQTRPKWLDIILILVYTEDGNGKCRGCLMQEHVPHWILVLIGAMYRFVVGAFGVSLPHPYKAGICPRLWVLTGSTVGLPVVLPVVLLGWAIRLTLGKGRAERFFDWLFDVSDTPQAKVLGKVLLWAIFIAAILVLGYMIGYMIGKYGWIVLLGALIAIGAIAAFIGLVVCAALLSEAGERIASRPKRVKEKTKEEKPSPVIFVSKKSWVVLKKTFVVVTWLPKMVLLVVWQILAFLGWRAYDFYKKRCPIVEFP